MKATLKYSSITNPNAKSRTSTHTLPIGLKCPCHVEFKPHKLIQWLKRRDLDERGGPLKPPNCVKSQKKGWSRSGGVTFLRKTLKNGEGGGWRTDTTDTSAWFWGMMQTSLPWRTRSLVHVSLFSHSHPRLYHTSDVLLIAQLVYCSITRGLHNLHNITH